MTTISIRGVSLFVQVMGQGYPLVLMHGGPGQDYTTLLPFKALADQFTLIFYDHRSNGHSEGADVSSMTWENLTADADALRETLGFDKWDEYMVRSWLGWHHHMTLCILAHHFLVRVQKQLKRGLLHRLFSKLLC